MTMARSERALCLRQVISSLLLLLVGVVSAPGQDSGVPPWAAETAESAPAPSPLPTEGRRLGANYIIGPEDILEIDVFGVPELTKVVRVASDGTISLALLGRVQAAGYTAQQFQRVLESLYGKKYLENPQITVSVREYRSQPVSIIGAVEKPGVYQIEAPRTLVEMLSMAGGLTRRNTSPAGRTVVITRKGGFGELPPAEGLQRLANDKIEINLQRLLYAQDEVLNIEIKPFDIISVARADIVYVVGGVKKPGGFVLEDRDKVTIIQALAMAEGFERTAAPKRSRIIRTAPDGSRTEIPVDISRILKQQSQDLELAANDILYVPDSMTKAALMRGAEAVLGTISGLLVYRTARY